ncbi:Rhs element Vgr protein [Caballeronia pedi]|uniref:Rhs element Vgr protein n=1 Tax=Caballeronia pedi TaxID=1777141 RepID=A0A158C0W4_9BURK|nr:type VI secretion system tip protein TssI/VgrG [Caballeronia pedi]SAK76014.1 Rhs element Vgr protein [Caballeronia pedi]
MPRQSDLRFTFEPASGVAFDVLEFDLKEALSEIFELTLELSSADPAVDFGKMLDQPALFTLWRGVTPVRYVHGIVSTFDQSETGFRRTRYQAVVTPALARTELCSDWRIFQQRSVPQLLQTLMDEQGVTDYEQQLFLEHLPREYCVQPGETTLGFIDRVSAEEGLYNAYFHSAKGHRLIHGDKLIVHGAIDGGPVSYNPNPGGDAPEPGLRSFRYTEQVRTARQTQRDYTFKHPQYNQQHVQDGANLDHQNREYERYDYPGRYKHDQAGKPFTQTRLLALRRDARLVITEGDDARLVPGMAFTLADHPREEWNRGWRPVRIEHRGTQHTSQQEESAEAIQGTHYSYTAELVPDDVEWKAPLLSKPRIDGPQIATVTGPAGEEIHTDEFARVTVQFPWDREGKNDEHSSCWIRVAQNWAGATWGHMAIPRIGQEVIVAFLDGDCDQPIIIGRTYHATDLPPYELPRHKTRMTIKSQTHKGEGFNELRFEDEKDQEEIYVHAQKNQNIEVNHDETTRVGHDRKEDVGNDEAVSVGNDRQVAIGHDDSLHVGQDRRETIGRDRLLNVGRNHQIDVTKDLIETVGNIRQERTTADRKVETGGNYTHRVQGRIETEAGERIATRTKIYDLGAEDRVVFRGPGGTITIDSSGITLDSTTIKLKGNLALQAPGVATRTSLGGTPNTSKPMDELCAMRADGTCPKSDCPCGKAA